LDAHDRNFTTREVLGRCPVERVEAIVDLAFAGQRVQGYGACLARAAASVKTSSVIGHSAWKPILPPRPEATWPLKGYHSPDKVPHNYIANSRK
jgi:hypothetical protein